MKNKSLITVEADQLTEVDVKAISFVKRGANQSPFKILKSEDVETQEPDTEEKRMINFGFDWLKNKSDKGEAIIEPDAYVGAVIIPDNDNADQLTEIIKSQEFSVENSEKKDGSIIYKQDENVELDKLTYFKSNDNVIVGVANVQKAFDPWSNSGSFAENMQKNSFLPGVSLAANVMQDTIFDILISSEKSEDMVKKVKSTVKEFSDFVVGLAQAVPAEAFKFENIKLEVEAKEEETSKEDNSTTEDKSVDKDDLGKALADSLETEDKATESEDSTEKVKEQDLGGLLATETEKIKGVTDSLVATMDKLSKSVEGSVAKLNERLDTIESRLEKNEEKVKSTFETLDNTILGTLNSDNSTSNESVRKRDRELTELDDAFWEGTLEKVQN